MCPCVCCRINFYLLICCHQLGQSKTFVCFGIFNWKYFNIGLSFRTLLCEVRSTTYINHEFASPGNMTCFVAPRPRFSNQSVIHKCINVNMTNCRSSFHNIINNQLPLFMRPCMLQLNTKTLIYYKYNHTVCALPRYLLVLHTTDH